MGLHSGKAAPMYRVAKWNVLSPPYALFLPVIPIFVFGVLGLTLFRFDYRVPEDIPFWTFLFGLPHIIASFQTTLDAEYLRRYKFNAAIALGIIFLPIALIELGLSPKIILMIFAIFTVHHVIAQQFGISLGVEKMRPNLFFSSCKWSIIALGVIAYFQSYFTYDLHDSIYLDHLMWLAEVTFLPTMVFIAISAALTLRSGRNLSFCGGFFLTNVVLMMIALMLIFKTPYGLVGLMMVRILHDSTSFVVYILHDHSRNQSRRRNVLYRLFPFLPIVILGPLLALGIAGTLSYASSYSYFVGWLVIGITLAHYYLEKFIWKRGAPHREAFSFN